MKKKSRKGMLVVLIVILLFCSYFVSNASENKGSIEITLTDGAEGTSKEGVVFGYRKVDLKGIEYAEDLRLEAEKLAEYGKHDGTAVTDSRGIATISNLEGGTYLLCASDKAEYDEIVPTFVTIPTWDKETGKMLYHIKVIPKHSSREVIEEVKTGDTTKVLGYVLGIISGISIAVFFVWKKRKERP